jgi:hypothetical protein
MDTNVIIEFDKWGFVWLSFEAEPTSGGDFCLFPQEVTVVPNIAFNPDAPTARRLI